MDAPSDRRTPTRCRLIGLRKYSLAVFASVCAGVFCWCGQISGGEWVTAQSLILGLYKAANVASSMNATKTTP